MSDFVIPTAAIVQVTPALAKQWLRGNEINRPLRPGRVATYSRDMERGAWALNGEAVKFSTENKLLDGQHRLHAVIKSGVTVPMLVVQGLPASTQATMDAGAKRTAGDVLSLDGNKYGHLLAAVAKKVLMWDSGDHRLSNNTTPTTAEIRDVVAKHPDLHRSVEIATRTRGSFRAIQPTITGVSHHLLSRVDVDDAVWFFARLADGAELTSGHPILTLRNRLANEAQDRARVHPSIQLAYVIRAWNAQREGRTLARILQGPKDPMPMPR